ncbi:MAG: hypothetical protein JNJ59_16220 [Deltaproteobacteria bacterium]|nr:hypothetical protein [Deltaproteobacteria bacterium]
MPLALDEVPSRPFIYLPVVAPAEDLAPFLASGALKVRVSDPAGQVVAGQVDLRPYDSNSYGALAGVVRWRPTAELAAGTYDASVVVADAPAEWQSEGCPLLQGFENKVSFTVAALASAPPAVSLAVAVKGEWDVVRVYGACSWVHEAVPCESPDGICCGRDLNPYRSIEATVRFEGAAPPPEYTALEVTFEYLAEPGVSLGRVYYPLDASTPLTSVATEPLHGAPAAGRGCVTANLVSLFLGPEAAPLASVRTCPDPSAYTEVPRPDPITACDPAECSTFEPISDVEGPDSGPEPEPEANPETDVTRPDGDTHLEVVEEAIADPNIENRSNGCAAGFDPSVAWLGLSLVVLGVRRVRRS